MKEYEKDYMAYADIQKAYDCSMDEKERKTAREKYKRWREQVISKGEAYATFFQLYKEARDAGNRYIDLHGVIPKDKVGELVVSFRKFGVEYFTISSGWSSAVSAAWLFTLCGCSIEKMEEVYAPCTKVLSGVHEKIPAYLFRVG